MWKNIPGGSLQWGEGRYLFCLKSRYKHCLTDVVIAERRQAWCDAVMCCMTAGTADVGAEDAEQTSSVTKHVMTSSSTSSLNTSASSAHVTSKLVTVSTWQLTPPTPILSPAHLFNRIRKPLVVLWELYGRSTKPERYD